MRYDAGSIAWLVFALVGGAALLRLAAVALASLSETSSGAVVAVVNGRRLSL